MAKDGDGWSVSSMGERALLATCGNKVSEGLINRVHRLYLWLLRKSPSGITDLVPAFASLLVRFDPAIIAVAKVRLWLDKGFRFAALETEESSTQVIEHLIPVHYGDEYGPDLESVAAMHSIATADVIRLHTSRSYNVAFLGFLPGFAYMGTLPRAIASPRLATPRQRVAGGSVGLAGYQTGVYPFASPGGWQIIGRTAAEVWNPLRPKPALFAPRDTVRFVPTRERIGQTSTAQNATLASHPVFEVVEARGLATVQDLGRAGYAHIGVGSGGAFDTMAARRANYLVGNSPGATVIEMALGGPTLRALQNCTIALDGADLQCTAGSMLIPRRVSWFVRAGTTLNFRAAAHAMGARAYLAVSSGFDVPLVFGSGSTSILAGFGGYAGRTLATGDLLGIHSSSRPPTELAGKTWSGKVNDISPKVTILRFVPFHGRQAALRLALAQFVARTWELTAQSDRMGCRFRQTEGDPLPTRKEELASFGVVTGAIQLPPGGLPVVLGVDCQTTGGYPLLGVVIEADMPLLAQISPGYHVRFVAVSVEEARLAQENSEHELSAH